MPVRALLTLLALHSAIPFAALRKRDTPTKPSVGDPSIFETQDYERLSAALAASDLQEAQDFAAAAATGQASAGIVVDIEDGAASSTTAESARSCVSAWHANLWDPWSAHQCLKRVLPWPCGGPFSYLDENWNTCCWAYMAFTYLTDITTAGTCLQSPRPPPPTPPPPPPPPLPASPKPAACCSVVRVLGNAPSAALGDYVLQSGGPPSIYKRMGPSNRYLFYNTVVKRWLVGDTVVTGAGTVSALMQSGETPLLCPSSGLSNSLLWLGPNAAGNAWQTPADSTISVGCLGSCCAEVVVSGAADAVPNGAYRAPAVHQPAGVKPPEYQYQHAGATYYLYRNQAYNTWVVATNIDTIGVNAYALLGDGSTPGYAVPLQSPPFFCPEAFVDSAGSLVAADWRAPGADSSWKRISVTCNVAPSPPPSPPPAPCCSTLQLEYPTSRPSDAIAAVTRGTYDLDNTPNPFGGSAVYKRTDPQGTRLTDGSIVSPVIFYTSGVLATGAASWVIGSAVASPATAVPRLLGFATNLKCTSTDLKGTSTRLKVPRLWGWAQGSSGPDAATAPHCPTAASHWRIADNAGGWDASSGLSLACVTSTPPPPPPTPSPPPTAAAGHDSFCTNTCRSLTTAGLDQPSRANNGFCEDGGVPPSGDQSVQAQCLWGSDCAARSATCDSLIRNQRAAALASVFEPPFLRAPSEPPMQLVQPSAACAGADCGVRTMRSYCGTERTTTSSGSQDVAGCFCCGMAWAGDWANNGWNNRQCTAFGTANQRCFGGNCPPADEQCMFYPAEHFGYTMWSVYMKSRYRCDGDPYSWLNNGQYAKNCREQCFTTQNPSGGNPSERAAACFTTQAAYACNTPEMQTLAAGSGSIESIFKKSMSDLRSGETVKDPCAETCLFMGAMYCGYCDGFCGLDPALTG